MSASTAGDPKHHCYLHLSAMITLMKDKVGYDSDEMIYLVVKWVRAGSKYPRHGNPKEQGKYYGKFFLSLLGGAAARSVLAENPADEEDAKEKLSKYLYNRLVALRDSIWADDGWGYLAFNGAEGAMLRMLWNYRVLLAREDASLGRKFERRLKKLQFPSV